MQIGRGVGPIEYTIAIVGAIYCAVVAYKSFDYVRELMRQKRENPHPPPPDSGADPDDR
jgi:hypothetical protein